MTKIQLFRDNMFGFRRLSLAYFLGAGIIAIEIIANLRAVDPKGLSLQAQIAIGVLASAFYAGDAVIKRKKFGGNQPIIDDGVKDDQAK